MPRPRLTTPPAVVQVKLRLYPGRDDDLIEFFSGIPVGLRSTMVKQALREGVRRPEASAEEDEWSDALSAFVLQ